MKALLVACKWIVKPLYMYNPGSVFLHVALQIVSWISRFQFVICGNCTPQGMGYVFHKQFFCFFRRSVLLRDRDLPPSLGGSGVPLAITTSASVSKGSHYEPIEFFGMRENEVAPGVRKEDDARAKESRHSNSPPQDWLLLTDEHLATTSMESRWASTL